MDLRGHNGVQVLTKGRFDVSPSFAPNGAVIIYATRDRGRGVLALVSSDGRVQQRLVSSEGELQEPAWGPF
jgi:TolB protein